MLIIFTFFKWGRRKFLPQEMKRITAKATLKIFRDFPGGAVVKNPPANAGVAGSSPGPGRSNMPRNN